VTGSSNTLSDSAVEALLGDVRHVVENVEPDDWADTAAAVLDHHSPPIDESLLSMKAERLQHWCLTLLEALIATDEDAIREAATMVQRYS
jgi:hypothetical protein